ncbi:hypothetical protein [Clostridium sp.]|uniref:hypothetical protein n=1 Tax=Clostridium sp. TaxID=1506 RepID=UPI0032170DCA
MLVDDSVVLKYLNGEEENIINSHWVFKNIEEGKYLFEVPNTEKRDDVNSILVSIKSALSQFIPLNKNIYSSLYPEWKSIINDINVLLIVGCPNPYDAMVRKYDGKEYIIFDLIRFCDYKIQGYDVELLIRQLITHETSHVCLHKQYPTPISNDFIEQLKYITFDESFAHLLAFKDNIQKFDFSTFNKYYNNSLIKLKEAMKETDFKRQKTLLEQADSGSYWNKFASISGKLFLASHLDEVEKIYNSGIESFISYMCV